MWVSSEEDIGNEFVISVNEPEQRNSVSSAFERSHGIRDNVDRTDLTRENLVGLVLCGPTHPGSPNGWPKCLRLAISDTNSKLSATG
jgi:hypothetical protein